LSCVTRGPPTESFQEAWKGNEQGFVTDTSGRGKNLLKREGITGKLFFILYT